MSNRLIGAISAAVVVFVAHGALAADLRAPKAAAPATNLVSDAFAALSVGGTWVEGDGTPSNNGLTVEGTASASYNFAPSLGVQGDVVYRNQQWNQGSSIPAVQVNSHDFEAAGHVFTRNEQYLLGAFAQYGEGYLGAYNGAVGVDPTHVFGGVEGQVFVGDATLYAQAGAKLYSLGNVYDVTGYFGTFEARYYLQPDFKIDAHIGYETLDINLSGSGTGKTFNLGLGAEYRVADTPFSLFAKYDYSNNSFGNGSIWYNRILAGVKFNFDAPTLEQRDRSGASLKPFESHDFDFAGSLVGTVVP